MALNYEIDLYKKAFQDAADSMAALKTDTELFEGELETLFSNLTNALNTPAGRQFALTTKDVIFQPVIDLYIVINHIATTLAQIVGTEEDGTGSSNYSQVFVKFEELNSTIKFEQ